MPNMSLQNRDTATHKRLGLNESISINTINLLEHNIDNSSNKDHMSIMILL